MVSKQEQEIFQAFVASEPNFAGKAVKCSVGSDPPDFLCQTNPGRKIGVEIGEWLHKAQTERSRAFEILEKEIAKEPIKRNFVDWLDRYGVLLYPKLEMDSSKTDGLKYLFPSKADRSEFISDLFDLLSQFKNSQPIRSEYFNDFSNTPGLEKFLKGLRIYRTSGVRRGIKFAQGGSYSPEDASEALIKIVRDKTSKCNYQTLKRDRGLDELYLVVYYKRALLWNSPYEGINGGIEVAVAQARAQSSQDRGPFDKVFLFLAFEHEMRVFAL